MLWVPAICLAGMLFISAKSSEDTSARRNNGVVIVNGTIGQGVECPYVLNGCNGGSWVISLPDGYSIGDQVRIVGRENNIISICMQGPHLGILSIQHRECN